jgi:hypothetical protein
MVFQPFAGAISFDIDVYKLPKRRWSPALNRWSRQAGAMLASPS